MEVKTRTCRICGAVKPEDQFKLASNHKPTRVCKSCDADIQREWYKKNADAVSLKRSLRLLKKRAEKTGFKLEFTLEKLDEQNDESTTGR